MNEVSHLTPVLLNPRMLILRGVLSVLFGIFAWVWPVAGLLSIVLIYGAYALVDGLMAIATGVRREKQHRSWGLPILEGIFGVGIGIVTFVWPGITLLALSILVGVWAIVTGIFEIMAAFQLPTYFQRLRVPSKAGRILMGIAGALSLILGGVIFMNPALGAVALLALVASYALIFGGVLIALGIHLQRHLDQEKTVQPSTKAA